MHKTATPRDDPKLTKTMKIKPDEIHRRHSEVVQVLNELLKQAFGSLAIRDKYQGFHVDAREYLTSLALHRRSYDPDLRSLADRYQPTIQNNAVRESLCDLIKDALWQYIDNDMLQSAKIVTGGVMDGFHIDELLEHLLTIACARGTEYAATNFYECVEKSSVEIQAITMIDGVTIKTPIEISEGIQLVPIPNDVKDFPPCIRIPHFIHYTDYFGRTLIIVDELVSPVFARPDHMSKTDFPAPFKRTNVNTQYPNFAEAEFCEALSLSTNHIVNYVSWWSHIDPDEVYAVNSSRDSAGYIPSRVHKHSISSIEVNERDIQEAMSLYVTRKNLDQNVAQKLRVPIDRWMKSKTDKNRVDAFINLGTALESLYLGDINGQGELGFRLALRAAWHLGNDAQERVALKKDFSKIYNLRSRAVHTGTLKESKASPEFTARAQELCLKSITKIMQGGEFPDWDQLVMEGERLS